MSALLDPIGGMLDVMVEAPRGMTDEEALRFLATGEPPNLLEPPVAGVGSAPATRDDDLPVMTEGDARLLLHGITPMLTASGGFPLTELIFRFNPDQPRDADGRWADVPGEGTGDAARQAVEALTGRRALESAPVSIAAEVGKSIECRPPTLDVCNDSEALLRYTALENYRGADYDLMNRLLRGTFDENNRELYVDDPEDNWADYAAQIDDKVRRIDETMQASALPDTVQVMRATLTGRGIFGDHLKEDDLTGFTWEERGFVSTTVVDDVLNWFTSADGGLVMHITVPRGVGAVQLSSMPDDATGYDEAELLLQRGLRMRVVHDGGRNENNVRTLWVEATPA